MRVVLLPVEALDDAGLEAAREIYEGGFPAHLRATWTQVSTERLDTEDALVLVDDSGPVAFVLVRSMGATDSIYLRYLVVDERRRGQGIGSRVWEHLTAYAAGRGFDLLVWDVEHPDEDGIDDAEKDVRTRRIDFYERLGGVVLAVPDYTNPHTDESGTHEVPMILMATGLRGTQHPLTDRHWLGRLVRDVNRYRWGR